MGAAREIWVTRSEPGAQETATKLRALGFEPVVAPLLQLRALPVEGVDLTGVGAIAFTSGNAVRAFAKASAERELSVFAVGDATAAAARDAGFARIHAGPAGVEELAQAIGEHRSQFEGDVLHAAAAEPAGDLAGGLAKRGIGTRSLALYDSRPARLPQSVLARLPTLHGVLLHSPKAARILAEMLVLAPAPNLNAYCLSRAVAEPLEGLRLSQVLIARSPNDDALLQLLVR